MRPLTPRQIRAVVAVVQVWVDYFTAALAMTIPPMLAIILIEGLAFS